MYFRYEESEKVSDSKTLPQRICFLLRLSEFHLKDDPILAENVFQIALHSMQALSTENFRHIDEHYSRESIPAPTIPVAILSHPQWKWTKNNIKTYTTGLLNMAPNDVIFMIIPEYDLVFRSHSGEIVQMNSAQYSRPLLGDILTLLSFSPYPQNVQESVQNLQNKIMRRYPGVGKTTDFQ